MRVSWSASSALNWRSVLRTSDRPAIHQQHVIVAGQRGVIMRGRKRSRLWPAARANDVAQDVHRSTVEADAHTDDALLALVRLLARQAAREVFAQSVTEYDSSVEEGRE
jgi:hypothetical protein